jgi:8-oxo-dGTP diphosphatase
MKTRFFTAGIVTREGRVLVLKRTEADDTYPGLWDCVGGHFEKGETAEECMMREAREETGLKPKLQRVGRLIEYRDEYGRAVAVPFLLFSASGRIKLTEHTESAWVSPGAARKLDSVPSLRKALDDFGL